MIQEGRKAEEWTKKAPALTIFVKNSASREEVQFLEQEIKNITGVKGVKYVSKEDAYKAYVEKNKDNPEITKLVSPDILPASLEVYLNDSSIKEKISQNAKTKSIVEEVTMLPSY